MADVSVTFGATDEGLEKTLKAVQGELNSLKDKVKGGELSMTELEGTMKRIGQVTTMEKNIKAIGDSSDTTTKSVKTLGTAAEETGKKGESGFGKIAVGAALAVAGTAAIDAAFAVAQKTVKSFGDALDMGGRLEDLSDRTGVAVDKVMLLERAFQNTGVGADSLGPIINKMQKAIVDAGDGTSAAADAFTKLGLPLSELQKLSPDEQLRAIGKAIAGIPDPAERAATSMEIFGKSGGALNQLFANMDGELDTAKAQLGSLPQIMKDGAAQFDKISDNIAVIGGKFIEFAAGLIDKVKPALDAITTALTRIDAAKIGQDLAGFFVGAGEGMKGFQAAVDAIEAGEIGTAFKIVGQAIQLQFKETANSIYTNIVAAFSTVAEFAGKIFDPSGALGQTIVQAFAFIGNKASAAIMGALGEAMKGSYLTRGMGEALTEMSKKAEETAKKAEGDLKGAGGRIADQFVEAGAAMPDSFDKNYNKIPPLFTDIEKHQQEIDRLQQGITESTKETTAAVSEADKAAAKTEQDARKAEKDAADKAEKALKDAEKSAKVEAEKQAKIEEVLRLKREEHNAQLGINNAIASGNFQEAEALKNANALKKTIDDLVKTGFGVDEATTLANEMARAAREADRVKNSLATKIGENIKSKEESEAVDPGGKLMKKAQEQIEKGQFKGAEATGRKLAARELDISVTGVGAGRDMRAAADTLKDYYGNKAPSSLTKQEQRELTRLAREEGVFKDFSKMTDSTKKGLDRFADLASKATKTDKDWEAQTMARIDKDVDASQKAFANLGAEATKSLKDSTNGLNKKTFDNSIANLNSEIKKNPTGGAGGPGGVGGNATAQGGNGGDGAEGGAGGVGGNATVPTTKMSLESMVEAIKTAVVSLETKLPQPVLA